MTSIAWAIVVVGILFSPEEGDNEIKVCSDIGLGISITMLLISTIHDLIK